MMKIFAYLRTNPLAILLIGLPLAVLAEIFHWGDLWVFLFSTLGIIPMAGYIGKSTESLAEITGPKVGGLLNATLGNAAELIITLVAIRAGLLELVKASITGSIIGNLLLVLGFSMVVGGARHGVQKFDRRQSANHATLLSLTIIGLIVPSLFGKAIGPEHSLKVEALTLGVSIVMMVLYGLGILYTMKYLHSPITTPAVEHRKVPEYTLTQALIVLALSTLGVVILSEMLVGAVETVTKILGLSEFFLGIILIPIVGNVAEHLVAVQVAARNQMELSFEIAVSSSLQIALLVAPLLVFISLAMGNPLTLDFNLFELLALGAGVVISALVSYDGESNWLEGAALLGVYLILGIAFFLMPG